MKKLLLTGAALALLAPSVANAAIVFTFTPGAATPTTGFTVINTFNTAPEQALVTGSGFQFKDPPADGNGAPPANSVPAGTTYLSVLTNGTANMSFGGSYSKIQFDWGSIDSYNTLRVFTTGADPVIIPGTTFTNPANGDQVSPGTNGVFSIYATAGEKFTGISLSSSANSFEVDNLAVGVPEPAAWAMMLGGFGLMGGAMRRRRRANVVYA